MRTRRSRYVRALDFCIHSGRTPVDARAHRRAAAIDNAKKRKIAKQAALADKLDAALEHQREINRGAS